MMPPTSIDGTDITGATIDGTDVQEITVDGQTVFTAAPPGAFDITQLNTSVVNTLSVPNAFPFGPEFDDTGTTLYVSSIKGGGPIYEYSLSTPFDLSSAGSPSTLSTVQSETPDIAFNDDGTEFFELTKFDLKKFTLSTPYDVSTRSGSPVQTQNSIAPGNNRGLSFNDDGTAFVIVTDDTTEMIEYSLPGAFDISTITQTHSQSHPDAFPRAAFWSPDGTKFQTGGSAGHQVYQFTASTPYDLSSIGGSFTTFSHGVNVTGLTWSATGDKMFLADNENDNITSYSL